MTVVAQAVPATDGALSPGERGGPALETLTEPSNLAPQDGWLEWATAIVPDSCVDARGFADQVARSLGRPPLAAARDAHLTIVARIDRASPTGQLPRWSGEIRVRDAQGRWVGSRTIDREGLSCRPLGEALALATALVLAKEDAVQDAAPAAATSEAPTKDEPTKDEPTKDEPTAPRSEATPPQEGSTASRRPEITARVEAAPPASKTRGWAVGLEGGLSMAVGLLPEAAIGGTVLVFFRFANGMKVFATGGAWSRQVVSTGAEQGATLDLASLGIGICPLGGAWRGFSGQACARVDGGRLRATGFGFTVSIDQDRPTVDAGAGFEVRRPLLGPVYTSISAGLVVPFVRDRISYSDNQRVVHPIFRPSPLAGTGELRLGASF